MARILSLTIKMGHLATDPLRSLLITVTRHANLDLSIHAEIPSPSVGYIKRFWCGCDKSGQVVGNRRIVL